MIGIPTIESLKQNLESRLHIIEEIKGLIDVSQSSNATYNKFKNLQWIISPAEKLPIASNSFDFYTISFGLRNTKNLDKTLKEAYRVLKPGGRFLCLEFSKIQNSNINV